MKKDSSISKLKFTEPKEPRIPNNITRSENLFLRSSTMKLSSSDEKKEKAMNLARKKLEIINFEDRLLGKAKEKARNKRLDKKNKKGIYGSNTDSFKTMVFFKK